MKERKANRLAGFDYSTDALYFVTSCVKDRICCFGEVINQEMICNEFGKIAEMQWKWLQNQYPYIISHAFVVMPNHIHAVLEINRNLIVGTGNEPLIVGTGNEPLIVGTGNEPLIVGTGNEPLIVGTENESLIVGTEQESLIVGTEQESLIVGTEQESLIVGTENESLIVGTGRDLSLQLTIPQKIKSISELIGAYKTTTSKKIHLAGYAEFQWQRSFHDHIIRNEKAYMQIVNYIETNPMRWEKDTFFS